MKSVYHEINRLLIFIPVLLFLAAGDILVMSLAANNIEYSLFISYALAVLVALISLNACSFGTNCALILELRENSSDGLGESLGGIALIFSFYKHLIKHKIGLGISGFVRLQLYVFDLKRKAR